MTKRRFKLLTAVRYMYMSVP